ncbi:terminase family protein [Asticcacaulis sp. EMRT-3]|uniref:DNA-packaging protein n=1 Tax=Asticcacaulis sp. EMRT-3 TaxID=3040349 RepID=UPI0024AED3EA|nr:terminase family protein [Asticcacaulis sp. EMRT-3]MDI7775390.1 terminase family protein [Asticcacaulis sp. EMRT-3]
MNASSIVSLPQGVRQDWISRHKPEVMKRLTDDWGFWSRPEQHPPEGDWHSWLFLGGRGAGKTRAGAQWLLGLIKGGVRVALVGPSLHDVREVMIEGPSGLRTLAGAGDKPVYEVSRRRLKWPRGGVAYAYSAEDPESLRGPQFHFAWADEFCAWKAPGETLAMLRMGLRLGLKPRLCVTTTPKPIAALRTLMGETGSVMTRSATRDNLAGLSDDFLTSLEGLYGGTRLAAQELDGLVVADDHRALWRADDLARCYGARPPCFDEVVVAVDPPASSHGDACGIVVAGRLEQRGYVLADGTVSGLSPLGWAQHVAGLVTVFGAQRVVAEANQGGEMIRSVLALAGCDVPIELVHARTGKRTRAEPVAALYEQGRISHCPEGARFNALDEELMALGSETTTHSPDRADALVWALTALLITDRVEPSLRRL